ncbi:MAG: hypothetical protein E7647_05910 [Ruminococcaceae bacterium]|nr:hypothetical protein [Oscillospiraceae bacterium]
MRRVSYFFGWIACVFAVSYYYKFFWDIFDGVWSQSSESMVYGFKPAGMPPFSWKINLLIWLSGIVLMAVVFGLVMDGICKSHYRKRKAMPLSVIIINHIAAVAVYIGVAVFSGYYERLYYMPRFLYQILSEAVPTLLRTSYVNRVYFVLCAFHTMIFSAMSLYFYLWEWKRQQHILKREKEYREERLMESK